MASLLRQPLPQLPRRRRLAGALQPEQQDDARPLGRRLQAPFGIAEERHHLVADDLDDLLRRRQAAQHLLAHRAVADAVDEGLDDLEIDVRLEQREPNLAQRGLDQVFGEAPLPAKRLENVLQTCAEGVKHWPLTCSSANAYRSGAAAGVSNTSALCGGEITETAGCMLTPIFWASGLRASSHVICGCVLADARCGARPDSRSRRRCDHTQRRVRRPAANRGPASGPFRATDPFSRARREPLTIDGRLDDAVWRTAAHIASFWQERPVEGAPATEQTEVHVAYDNERLYFGIYAHYSDPSLVRANRVDRDATENDDTVTFYIDPFLDQQRAYVFSVNGYGVQRDALLAAGTSGGSSGGGDESWNALFASAGQLVDDGWTAEMAIPFKSLRYPAREAAKATGGGFRSNARSKRRTRSRNGRLSRATCWGSCGRWVSSTASRISRRRGTSSSCPRSPRSPSGT